MPKRKHDCHNEFESIDNGNVQCRHCKTFSIRANATRQRRHLTQCPDFDGAHLGVINEAVRMSASPALKRNKSYARKHNNNKYSVAMSASGSAAASSSSSMRSSGIARKGKKSPYGASGSNSSSAYGMFQQPYLQHGHGGASVLDDQQLLQHQHQPQLPHAAVNESLLVHDDERVRMELAKVIFLLDLPFDFWAFEPTVSALKLLRPSFIAPTGYTVSEVLLPRLYAETAAHVVGNVDVENAHTICIAAVSCDGWSDKSLASTGLSAVMLCTPLPYLIGTLDRKKKELARNATNAVEQTRRIVAMTDRYFVNANHPVPMVICFGTDSVQINRMIRKNVVLDEVLSKRMIMVYGCARDALVKHISEVTSQVRSVADILDAAERVVKCFKGSSDKNTAASRAKVVLNDAYLKRGEVPKLQSARVRTQWDHRIVMLQSLMNSKGALQDVARLHAQGYLQGTPLPIEFLSAPQLSRSANNHRNLNGPTSQLSSMDVYSLIADERDTFWRALKAAECLLRPMYFCVDVLRNDHAPLSMVVGCFVLLHRFYRSFAMKYVDDANMLSFHEDDGNYDAFLRASLRTMWHEVTADSDMPDQSQESVASMLLHVAFFLDPAVTSTDDELALEGFALSHFTPRAAAMEGIKYLGQAVGEDLTSQFSTYLLNSDDRLARGGGDGSIDNSHSAHVSMDQPNDVSGFGIGSMEHSHNGPLGGSGNVYIGAGNGPMDHSQSIGVNNGSMVDHFQSVVGGGVGDVAQHQQQQQHQQQHDVLDAGANALDELCNDSQVMCHPLKRWLDASDSSKLCQVAVSLFRVPASPTAEKRIFQVTDPVRSKKKRIRLSSMKARMVSTIKFNLKQLERSENGASVFEYRRSAEVIRAFRIGDAPDFEAMISDPHEDETDIVDGRNEDVENNAAVAASAASDMLVSGHEVDNIHADHNSNTEHHQHQHQHQEHQQQHHHQQQQQQQLQYEQQQEHMHHHNDGHVVNALDMGHVVEGGLLGEEEEQQQQQHHHHEHHHHLNDDDVDVDDGVVDGDGIMGAEV